MIDATLYKHVGSKDGLLEAVQTRRLRTWTEHRDAAIAAATNTDRPLLASFDAVVSCSSVRWRDAVVLLPGHRLRRAAPLRHPA